MRTVLAGQRADGWAPAAGRVRAGDAFLMPRAALPCPLSAIPETCPARRGRLCRVRMMEPRRRHQPPTRIGELPDPPISNGDSANGGSSSEVTDGLA
jgi:hypothetical protein